MITSEALQLGPDTSGPHEKAREILCFVVTTAGGRTVKTFARKRYIPIRWELLELGLMDLVEETRRDGGETLWPEAEKVGRLASGYFSSFWARFAANLGVAGDNRSLYSFRHSFQDAIKDSEFFGLEKPLMGHAEAGMTGRYGRKRKPRVVPDRKAELRHPTPLLALACECPARD